MQLLHEVLELALVVRVLDLGGGLLVALEVGGPPVALALRWEALFGLRLIVTWQDALWD